MRSNRVAGLVLLVGFAVLPACGITSDGSPRPVQPDIVERDLSGDPRSPVTGDGAVIYLVAPAADGGDAPVLQPVDRTTQPGAAAALSALFRGASAAELEDRLRSSIPAEVGLLGVSQRGATLVVNTDPALEQISGPELVTAIAQVVFTATAIEGIDNVLVTVQGVARQWPAGNGELQSRPLSRYDFPGFLPTAQPPFPAVPSREDDVVSPDATTTVPAGEG